MSRASLQTYLAFESSDPKEVSRLQRSNRFPNMTYANGRMCQCPRWQQRQSHFSDWQFRNLRSYRIGDNLCSVRGIFAFQVVGVLTVRWAIRLPSPIAALWPGDLPSSLGTASSWSSRRDPAKRAGGAASDSEQYALSCVSRCMPDCRCNFAKMWTVLVGVFAFSTVLYAQVKLVM